MRIRATLIRIGRDHASAFELSTRDANNVLLYNQRMQASWWSGAIRTQWHFETMEFENRPRKQNSIWQATFQFVSDVSSLQRLIQSFLKALNVFISLQTIEMVSLNLVVVHRRPAVLIPLTHDIISPLLLRRLQGRHWIDPEDIILAHLSTWSMLFEKSSHGPVDSGTLNESRKR